MEHIHCAAVAGGYDGTAAPGTFLCLQAGARTVQSRVEEVGQAVEGRRIL